MSRKELMLLIVLASMNFTNIMDFMIMMPLQEYLVPVFHITPNEFGWLVSVFAFSAFLSSLTASFFVDRFDRKRTLLFAYSGFVAGTLACGFASTYTFLVIARIITGLFGGLISAQVLSIVGDTIPYERRGRAMGILMGAFSLAAVAGVPIGLFVATRLNWQAPFIIIGALGMLIIPAILYVVPQMRGHVNNSDEKDTFEMYRSVWQSRNLKLGLLMMFTLIVSHFATIPFIAPYLEKNVGFDKDQISLMYFLGGVITFFSSPAIGKLSDRLGKHRVFSFALLLSVIPVFLITNMPRIPVYYGLTATTLFFLIAGGRMIPAQALIASVVPPHLRGGFMNLNASIQQFGTGLAAFMAGSIVTKNGAGELVHYEIVGYISICISMICLLVMRKVKPMDRVEGVLP